MKAHRLTRWQATIPLQHARRPDGFFRFENFCATAGSKKQDCGEYGDCRFHNDILPLR